MRLQLNSNTIILLSQIQIREDRWAHVFFFSPSNCYCYFRQKTHTILWFIYCLFVAMKAVSLIQSKSFVSFNSHIEYLFIDTFLIPFNPAFDLSYLSIFHLFFCFDTHKFCKRWMFKLNDDMPNKWLSNEK